jgi:phage FluMu protein Com
LVMLFGVGNTHAQPSARCRFSSLDAASKNTTFIDSVFRGHLRGTVKCPKCKHVSSRFEPTLDISLEIKRASSLKKALRHFTAPEQLDSDNLSVSYIWTNRPSPTEAAHSLVVGGLPPPMFLLGHTAGPTAAPPVLFARLSLSLWQTLLQHSHNVDLPPLGSSFSPAARIHATFGRPSLHPASIVHRTWARADTSIAIGGSMRAGAPGTRASDARKRCGASSR